MLLFSHKNLCKQKAELSLRCLIIISVFVAFLRMGVSVLCFALIQGVDYSRNIQTSPEMNSVFFETNWPRKFPLSLPMIFSTQQLTNNFALEVQIFIRCCVFASWMVADLQNWRISHRMKIWLDGERSSSLPASSRFRLSVLMLGRQRAIDPTWTSTLLAIKERRRETEGQGEPGKVRFPSALWLSTLWVMIWKCGKLLQTIKHRFSTTSHRTSFAAKVHWNRD